MKKLITILFSIILTSWNNISAQEINLKIFQADSLVLSEMRSLNENDTNRLLRLDDSLNLSDKLIQFEIERFRNLFQGHVDQDVFLSLTDAGIRSKFWRQMIHLEVSYINDDVSSDNLITSIDSASVYSDIAKSLILNNLSKITPYDDSSTLFFLENIETRRLNDLDDENSLIRYNLNFKTLGFAPKSVDSLFLYLPELDTIIKALITDQKPLKAECKLMQPKSYKSLRGEILIYYTSIIDSIVKSAVLPFFTIIRFDSSIIDNDPMILRIEDKNVCFGSDLDLGERDPHGDIITVTGGSGEFTYLWYPSSGLINANTGNPTLLKATQSGYYKLMVTDTRSLEIKTASMKVTVLDLPYVVLKPNNISIKKGSSTVNLGNSINVTNGSAPFSYYWTDKNGWTSTEHSPSVSPTKTTRYFLIIIDANGCISQEKNILVTVRNRDSDIDFSRNKYEYLNDLFIYPNPSKDIFNIEASFEKPLKAEIKLTNLLGEDIYYEKIIDENDYIHHQLDLSEFPKGVYFIRVYFNNEVLVEKIIKE